MKPRSFRYHAPKNAGQALEILAAEDEDARVLAGGQSLVPLMNLRFSAPSALVDINRCEDLKAIRVEDGRLVIGAAVTQRAAELSDVVARCCPLVATALSHNGHPATRNRGTVGGTLAHADPGAELPGVAVALGAEFVLGRGGERRVVTAEEFFLGPLTTSIEPGEMLLEVRFPVAPAEARHGFAESGIRSHDLAIAGIVVALEGPADDIRDARVAAFGVGPIATRLRTLEAALREGRSDRASIAEAAAADLEEAEILENLHATADYRRSLALALAERAILSAA